MRPELLFLILISSPGICLGKCFSVENKSMECVDLPGFPRGEETIQVLRATNNTFVKIASNTLWMAQFAFLKAAILPHNHIRAISARAFGIPSLLLLDLTKNDLKELSMDAFAGAPALKVLILRQNRLRSIKSTPLMNLIYLDLSHNYLQEASFLQDLSSIKYLDISYNPLNLSRPGPILSSETLTTLRISLGVNKEITPDLFADLPYLQVLDLSSSRLKVWPVRLLHPLYNLRVLYMNKLLINEDPFVPATVEKIVQSGMEVTSTVLVSKILEHLDEFDAFAEDIEFLQYLDDFVRDPSEFEGRFRPGAHLLLRKCLLFALLVYLSLMYTICLSQVAKSFMYRPYQLVYVDEI